MWVTTEKQYTTFLVCKVETLQNPAQSSLAKCGVNGVIIMINASSVSSNSLVNIMHFGTFWKKDIWISLIIVTPEKFKFESYWKQSLKKNRGEVYIMQRNLIFHGQFKRIHNLKALILFSAQDSIFWVASFHGVHRKFSSPYIVLQSLLVTNGSTTMGKKVISLTDVAFFKWMYFYFFLHTQFADESQTYMENSSANILCIAGSVFNPYKYKNDQWPK